MVRRVEEKLLDNLPGIIGQFFISRSVLNEKREMVNVDSGSCGTGKNGVNHGK